MMILSKLYTNFPEKFLPLKFNPGLNVILAEIRLPENKEKDTHNLGKTTLGYLIDFCLLKERSKDAFLFEFDCFKDFIFFLELKLNDGSYLTIKRSVSTASKISLLRHSLPNRDFISLPDDEWDHVCVPFVRAKELVDSIVNFSDQNLWSFRQALTYALRTQSEYLDLFKITPQSKDRDWKPYLANILGLEAESILSWYNLAAEIENLENEISVLNSEISGIVDKDQINSLLVIKNEEAEVVRNEMNTLDFSKHDKALVKSLVDEIDQNIAIKNNEFYSLNFSIRRIEDSLQDERIYFNPDEAEALFEEAGIQFPGQLKKDFECLIAFNKAITIERQSYLQEELTELRQQANELEETIKDLNQKRSISLSFLKEKDVLEKYKRLSMGLVELQTEIAILENKSKYLDTIMEKKQQLDKKTADHERLKSRIELDIHSQKKEKVSLFSTTLLYFNAIVKAVIDRKAILKMSQNKNGNLEFQEEIVDEKGNATAADDGSTYKKLLCIAFDLALVRAHLKGSFIRFVYHDGVFEALDNRKKIKLLEVMREYAELGIQQIITSIDSDLPNSQNKELSFCTEKEIILMLHDEGESGRLFKMPAW